MKKEELRKEMLNHLAKIEDFANTIGGKLELLDSRIKVIETVESKPQELVELKNRVEDLESEIKVMRFLVESPYKFKVGDSVVIEYEKHSATNEGYKFGPTTVLSRKVEIGFGFGRCLKMYEVFNPRNNQKFFYTESVVSLAPKD
jgi:hypothetical protein